LHFKWLLPQGQFFFDSSDIGHVGAAILATSPMTILDSGHKGDGTFVWIKVSTVQGPVHIASVYALVDRYRRLQFWKWLAEFLKPEDNWVLMGDMNMVELLEDSAGTTTVAHGAEARRWGTVLDKFDLIDLYFCASRQRGTWFSRQQINGNRIDQARLDRFYCSNQGSWFQHVSYVDHDSRQTLSDHFPI
jgi:endonuclease/exonuclease/phosphatase family metal-dependent hydrolase